MAYEYFPTPIVLKHLGGANCDTGGGVHLSGDNNGYSEDSIALLYKSGFRWATLLSLGKELGDAGGWSRSETIQLLLKYGIMPISRYYLDKGYDSITPTLAGMHTHSMVMNFAEAGYGNIKPYIQIGNEYNLTDEWGTDKGSISPIAAANVWYAAACAVIANGGIPLTTPCSPGGNYNDWAYFVTFLKQVKLLAAGYPGGVQAFFSKIAIAVHNYTDNKPLNWGKGGYKKWAKRNPFAADYDPVFNSPGYEDSQGFCMYEWYHDYALELTGVDIPVLSTEGGCTVGDGNITYRPKIDEGLHASYITSQIALMMGDPVTDLQIVDSAWYGGTPAYYFCTAFWTWGLQPGWFNSDIRLRAETLKRLAGMVFHQRTPGIQVSPAPVPQPQPQPAPVPAVTLQKLKVEYREPGRGLVTGNLTPGMQVDVEFFSNHVRVTAGTKPEYGPGGFEALVYSGLDKFTVTVSAQGCEPLTIFMDGRIPFLTLAPVEQPAPVPAPQPVPVPAPVPQPVKTYSWQLRFANDYLKVKGTALDPGAAIENPHTIMGDADSYIIMQRGAKGSMIYLSDNDTTYISLH